MRFKDLSSNDVEFIKERYKSNDPRKEIQKEIANRFGINIRTVRKWANKLEIGLMGKNIVDPSKILIYDIETPRLRAEVWWSGKQFVNGKDIIDEPKIISISWKWLGEDHVHSAHWDLESQDDRDMMELFLSDYNEADLVVGVNNNNFDNRWVNLRALKHGLDVNTFVRSLDIQKEAKRLLRLPSYSLSYMCDFFDVPFKKQTHEGLIMWHKIQYGTMEEREEYMKKMIDYNVGDILATESLYLRMLPVLDHMAHLGVMAGNPNYSCPHCGETEEIELVKTTVTKAGSIQRIMRCKIDGTKYKISNRAYLNWFNS